MVPHRLHVEAGDVLLRQVLSVRRHHTRRASADRVEAALRRLLLVAGARGPVVASLGTRSASGGTRCVQCGIGASPNLINSLFCSKLISVTNNITLNCFLVRKSSRVSKFARVIGRVHLIGTNPLQDAHCPAYQDANAECYLVRGLGDGGLVRGDRDYPAQRGLAGRAGPTDHERAELGMGCSLVGLSWCVVRNLGRIAYLLQHVRPPPNNLVATLDHRIALLRGS